MTVPTSKCLIQGVIRSLTLPVRPKSSGLRTLWRNDNIQTRYVLMYFDFVLLFSFNFLTPILLSYVDYTWVYGP